MALDTDRLIRFAQALVRTPSVTGNEGAAAALVMAELRGQGFDRVWMDDNGSVLGVVEGAAPGPTILFDAHLDTVGVVPGSAWTREPFGGELVDGTLYGRGAADMKGALAAMVHGVAALDRGRLAGRAVVSASVLEEVMEGGSLRAIMDALRPDFVVIGEATNLNLNRGGRGRAEIHIEAIGRPAHSSSPHLGLNAIHEMVKIITSIERLPLPADPVLGPAQLVLTDIISEPYPAYSVIAGRCRVTYDRRLLPGETPESVLGAITALRELQPIHFTAALAQGEHCTHTGAVLRGPKFFPAWLFAEDHPFIQTALRGLAAAGLTPALGAYRFCTNAAYSAGTARVPTVGFGPAAEGDAHVVNERLELAALARAAQGYHGLAAAALGAL